VNNDILNLTNLGKTESEEIPEPGSEENPWIGFDRFVNGRKQFYALSGAERRTARRADARAKAAEQRKGQRAYNRQERKREFDAGTVRQQMRILSGELQVSFDMQNNLTAHIMRQTRLNTRADGAEDRRLNAEKRRSERLYDRSRARVDAGTARHADLVRLGLRPRAAVLHTEA
jgi:hypothetical protein